MNLRNLFVQLITAGLACMLLVGCAVAVERPVPPPVDAGVPFAPTPAASVVVTLVPAATRTPTLVDLPGSVTPAPTAAQTGQFDDALQGGVVLTPNAPPAQPWQDCSLAGGWIGCDPSAPKLPARLAFLHAAGPAAVALNLESSEGWSVPAALTGSDPRLSWSPHAGSLLVTQNDSQAAVYAADGSPLGSLDISEESGQPPAWQSDGSLAWPETVRSSDGATAQLLQDDDFRWQILYTPAGAAAPTRMSLEAQPTDRLYHLIGFAPGQNKLIGQGYFAGNQVMMQGAQLFLFDLDSGVRTDLEALAPLGWQAAYAWSPGSSPVLAFADTGGAQIGLPTLALFDINSGELRRPLPENIAVHDMAWRPDSASLAFAAGPAGTLASPEAAAFRLPAIYLLETDSGAIRAVTQPPAGARDGLPVWAGGGQWLLYARYFDQGALEVRAVQPDSGQEWVVVSGLIAECPVDGPGCPWDRWIAMEGK